MLAAGGAARLRQLVGLEAVDAAEVGEEQDPVVGGADEEVLHHVVLLQLGAAHALAAAFLALVGVDLGALGVAGGGDGDHHVFAGDEVFFGDVAGRGDDAGAALIAILIDDLLELVADNCTLALRLGQDVLVVRDLFFDGGQVVDNLLALQGGQAAQLHGQDLVGLDLVDVEQVDQAGAGVVHSRRAADQGDDLVQHVQRLDQAAEDVGALFGLVQAVLGAADDDFDLVLDVEAQHLVQAQGARDAVDNAQHVGGEVRLQRRVLVQVVQHHARHRVALECDHDAHAHAVGGLVLDLGDAHHLAGGDLLGDVVDEVVRVDLVGQLGDRDDLAVANLLDLGHTAHADGAAAGGVGVLDALVAHDQACRGEVRALHALHHGVEGFLLLGVVVVQDPVDRLRQLVQVVRRDVRGHADRDAVGAVHQQVRHARWQDGRLLGLAVVVGREVHGVFADVAHHLHGQRSHLALRVTHGGRAVIARRTEVALAVHKRVAHGPRLRHAHQGVVDGDVAVRVVVTHGVRDRLRALHVGALGTVAVVVHRVDDAAVHRLHAVAHIRERATHDHAHGVIDVAGLHLLVDVDWLNAVQAASGVISHVNESSGLLRVFPVAAWYQSGMAMTLRLTADEDKALVLLASAWGCSKQEAARRAVVTAASRLLDDAHVTDLARTLIPTYASMESRIRQARS